MTLLLLLGVPSSEVPLRTQVSSLIHSLDPEPLEIDLGKLRKNSLLLKIHGRAEKPARKFIQDFSLCKRELVDDQTEETTSIELRYT